MEHLSLKKEDTILVGGRAMSDYLIWASEKLSEKTDIPVDQCMTVIIELGSDLKEGTKYSVETYMKEEE